MNQSMFLQHVTEHQAICEWVKSLEDDVNRVSQVISAAVKDGGKIMLCGNGGSAADSQNIAAVLCQAAHGQQQKPSGVGKCVATRSRTAVANLAKTDKRL